MDEPGTSLEISHWIFSAKSWCPLCIWGAEPQRGHSPIACHTASKLMAYFWIQCSSHCTRMPAFLIQLHLPRAERGTWEPSPKWRQVRTPVGEHGKPQREQARFARGCLAHTQHQHVCCKPWAFSPSSCSWRHKVKEGRKKRDFREGILGRTWPEKYSYLPKQRGESTFSLQL